MNVDRLIPSNRVAFAPDQRDLIERKITEFISENVNEDFRRAATSAHALPLYFDWTACMAIRPDGQVIWIEYETPHQVRQVEDDRERNVALFRGSRKDPDLGFLVPERSAEAVDCRGTGRVQLREGQEKLAEALICFCGGTGWLPASSPVRVRPSKDLWHVRIWRRHPCLTMLGMAVTISAVLFALSYLGLFPWSE